MASSTDHWARAARPDRPQWRCGRWARHLAAALLGLAPALAAGAEDASRLLIEVEAQPVSPYVQARMIYSVRVLARVPMRQATLSDPVAPDASLRRLGEDRRWQEPRAGEQYNVLERRWALVPRRVGPLVITGPTLRAAVPAVATGAQKDTALIERLETLTRDAGPLTVAVRPLPAAAQTPWLPAEAVSISEDWEPRGAEAHVGVPLTRNLRVIASGASAAQLPDLALSDSDGFKVYVDPPRLSEELSGDDLLATLTLRATYVPIAPGRGEVPALRVPWWNLGLDVPAQAQLAGRTINIIGPSAEPVKPAPETPADDAPATPADRADAGPARWHSPWLSAALALAWLVTLVQCRRRRSGPPRPAPAVIGTGGLLAARQRFERACRDADAPGARAALLDWGTARWPASPPHGLEQLFGRLAADDAALALARGLDAHLYSEMRGDWAPGALLRVCKSLLRDPAREAERGADGALPPLYPTAS